MAWQRINAKAGRCPSKSLLLCCSSYTGSQASHLHAPAGNSSLTLKRALHSDGKASKRPDEISHYFSHFLRNLTNGLYSILRLNRKS